MNYIEFGFYFQVFLDKNPAILIMTYKKFQEWGQTHRSAPTEVGPGVSGIIGCSFIPIVSGVGAPVVAVVEAAVAVANEIRC